MINITTLSYHRNFKAFKFFRLNIIQRTYREIYKLHKSIHIIFYTLYIYVYNLELYICLVDNWRSCNKLYNKTNKFNIRCHPGHKHIHIKKGVCKSQFKKKNNLKNNIINYPKSFNIYLYTFCASINKYM